MSVDNEALQAIMNDHGRRIEGSLDNLGITIDAHLSRFEPISTRDLYAGLALVALSADPSFRARALDQQAREAHQLAGWMIKTRPAQRPEEKDA